MTDEEWNTLIFKRERPDQREFYREYLGQFHTGHLVEHKGDALVCEVVGKDRPETHCPEPVTHKVTYPSGRCHFVCSLCAKNVLAGAYGLTFTIERIPRREL